MRFRLFGIPFEIGLYFWIGSALFGSYLLHTTNGPLKLAIWVACVLVSIVVHELGHALMARGYKLQPYVLLHGIGGVTIMPGPPLTRLQSIQVSLAGPAMGFALWALVRTVDVYLFSGSAFEDDGSTTSYVVSRAIGYLLYINLVWTIFNLLPILPLDGGQVLRDVLGPRLLPVTRIIGAVCAGLLCVYEAMHNQIYMALFLGFLAFSNFTGNTRNMPGGVRKG